MSEYVKHHYFLNLPLESKHTSMLRICVCWLICWLTCCSSIFNCSLSGAAIGRLGRENIAGNLKSCFATILGLNRPCSGIRFWCFPHSRIKIIRRKHKACLTAHWSVPERRRQPGARGMKLHPILHGFHMCILLQSRSEIVLRSVYRTTQNSIQSFSILTCCFFLAFYMF